MKITEEVTRTETKTEIVDILCNRCGESCGAGRDYHGLLEAEVRGGYSSPHLEDMTSYTFSLCERCLVELFSYFHYPPSQRTEHSLESSNTQVKTY